MENSNAQNFVVYAEWWEAISMLSNEQKGVLFQAMFSTSTGQCAMPEMDTSTKMAFLLIRPRIVAAQEKYAAKVAANRENGKKGGRPAKPVEDDKINPEEPREKPKNPTVFFGNPTDNPKTHNMPPFRALFGKEKPGQCPPKKLGMCRACLLILGPVCRGHSLPKKSDGRWRNNAQRFCHKPTIVGYTGA